MLYVTRRETFSSAHRIFNPELSDEENFKVFGKCSNPNWHGHNYVLEVVVCGEIDSKTGYVIDLNKLKEIIKEHVISKVDHKNLNIETDFMNELIPSAENITTAIFKQLEDKIPSGKLYSVKLYETENNYFEYKG
ncbi:MAG TPA: 6-carboxytetrahydropterin synthase [Ignavibacteriaceae bacterium]|nr:6-carboxytetrahydropterin synthase [Ignavibacteriaceae bacterium]